MKDPTYCVTDPSVAQPTPRMHLATHAASRTQHCEQNLAILPGSPAGEPWAQSTGPTERGLDGVPRAAKRMADARHAPWGQLVSSGASGSPPLVRTDGVASATGACRTTASLPRTFHDAAWSDRTFEA
eukprot:CAMPEP_0177435042 /NCGR_PEP_ID=MMETSP0369-20130122/838_1 /TAXON_ID=447022 ORGANISM="Scrippsiella hangoei-like, Strain SHHI-4" /NCGR_SAMPLE_ID=MMETSP0369 /ASSEMBLY_ACC=CAM_ASM_000364 /LENGTH=127 /DNA_ID=CAMNT_0018906171 /DNA_START=283 /DNA_END=666 /DNA_ORIENTATION=+